MTLYEDDRQLFALMRGELFTAVVGDVLDAAGYTHQFLPPQLRPLDPGMVVIGRAMPVLEADCHGEAVASSGQRQPFGLMFEALDDLKRDEVYICTGSSLTYALWGELMSTRAQHLGAAGAVLDGYSRDTPGILKLDFPTFSHGTYAQDQRLRGRVIDYRCSIEFPNGVVVEPGDIVFGDVDGVVIVPRKAEHDIIAAAIDKVRGENRVRAAIEGGMSTVEAFRTFGIM
jgi:4-hydroxy-4-methyl-2-oxoglutarate aldolase